MLTGLSVRDIVLIEKLSLSFTGGLTVLTGETGAGKSILLDSLGLATGARADRGLVRQGSEQGTVIAEFDLLPIHPACVRLLSEGLDAGDGTVILRRQITADGRSKAWVNDQPISRTLMAELGAMLLEVHGQHDDRTLLDLSVHRNLVDSYGGHQKAISVVAAAYKQLGVAKKNLEEAEAELLAVQKDEEFILHAQEELASLNPMTGEEEELANQRTLMMQGEKLLEDFKSYHKDLSGRQGIDSALRGVLRRMERTEGALSERLHPIIQSMDRASIEISEGVEELEKLITDIQFDPQDLDAIEERLFEIRRLARKHGCSPDQLADVYETFEDRAKALSTGDASVLEAKRILGEAADHMRASVEALRKARTVAARKLDMAVTAELPPLKLEKATFRTLVAPLEEKDWNQSGGERLSFEVKTNPNTPFGPMLKVASGGELARFILALKVVLAEVGCAPVMVFDEVDRGLGGATASAVGERLKRLSDSAQVLVVTHSPQVAACGDHQFQISKADHKAITYTSVNQLQESERREEIARMLAGAEITEAARAAADQLLNIGE